MIRIFVRKVLVRVRRTMTGSEGGGCYRTIVNDDAGERECWRMM